MSCNTHDFAIENDEMLPKMISHLITPEWILSRFVACLGIPGHLYDCMGHYFDMQDFESVFG